MKIDSNTILITGGTAGIGFELANQLIKLGNNVIITGRDQVKLDLAKEKLPNVHIFQCDVSDPVAISALFEKVTSQFPNLNFLINNAGIARKLNFHTNEFDLEDIRHEIDINFSGSIWMVKQFLPHLKTKKSAAILNVSSLLAFVPAPISPVYCATKAGIHSFTQSLRIQLKNTNVKVFELAPPLTKTLMVGRDFSMDDFEGIKPMDVGELVKATIKGVGQDHFEIRPGLSNMMKFMSRLAPQFMLNQLSKSVDKMLNQTAIEQRNKC
jgi:uncharacterized oxidoreductase